MLQQNTWCSSNLVSIVLWQCINVSSMFSMCLLHAGATQAWYSKAHLMWQPRWHKPNMEKAPIRWLADVVYSRLLYCKGNLIPRLCGLGMRFQQKVDCIELGLPLRVSMYFTAPRTTVSQCGGGMYPGLWCPVSSSPPREACQRVFQEAHQLFPLQFECPHGFTTGMYEYVCVYVCVCGIRLISDSVACR